METTNLSGEEPSFEEINGVRYALWTAESEPIGMGNPFEWAEFTMFLFGLAAVMVTIWSAAFLSAADACSPEFAMGCVVAVPVMLVAVLLRGGHRKARRLRTKRFEDWVAREPHVDGIPCTLTVSSSTLQYAESGLLSIEGRRLVFRGRRFSARFASRDLSRKSSHGVLRFAQTTPLGNLVATVILGGPSEAGWVTKRDALKAAAAPLDAWRETAGEVESVFPPLRYPSVRFGNHFLTRTLPLALAVYMLFWLVVAAVPAELLRSRLHMGPAISTVEWIGFTGGLYAFYGLLIAVGYIVRAVTLARNRRIDGLVAAERTVG